MFIKALKLTNFKGFKGEHDFIEFGIPDGLTEGSGLNVLVGENNTGKSSLFEAIEFVKEGSSSAKELVSKHALLEDESVFACVEMQFCGEIAEVVDAYAQANKKAVFKDQIFQLEEQNIIHLRRTSVDDRKVDLLSKEHQDFKNFLGIDAPIQKLFDLHCIWADTNPNDEASYGASTFCGLIFKEMAKNYAISEEFSALQQQFDAVFNQDSDLKKQIQGIEKNVIDILKDQFGDIGVEFAFSPPEATAIFKTLDIHVNDGISTKMSQKGHGLQRALALSLIQVYANLLIEKQTDNVKAKPYYLFIDEPEICLHPKAQQTLLNALLKLSKHQQIFITTHSPFFLTSPFIQNATVLICSKDVNQSKIESIRQLKPYLPWGPTWGEICYRAYKQSSVEFHNELYGYLQELSGKMREGEIDTWFKSQIERPIFRDWQREDNGKVYSAVPRTLQVFIRNHIHHPENKTMQAHRYTEAELELSIAQMIVVLENYLSQKVVEDVEDMNVG